jgi:hypothetical protein
LQDIADINIPPQLSESTTDHSLTGKNTSGEAVISSVCR